MGSGRLGSANRGPTLVRVTQLSIVVTSPITLIDREKGEQTAQACAKPVNANHVGFVALNVVVGGRIRSDG